MELLDILRRKRDGCALTQAEIAYFVRSVTDGTAPHAVSDSAITSASSAAVRRRESVLCFIVGSFRRRAAARK